MIRLMQASGEALGPMRAQFLFSDPTNVTDSRQPPTHFQGVFCRHC